MVPVAVRGHAESLVANNNRCSARVRARMCVWRVCVGGSIAGARVLSVALRAEGECVGGGGEVRARAGDAPSCTNVGAGAHYFCFPLSSLLT